MFNPVCAANYFNQEIPADSMPRGRPPGSLNKPKDPQNVSNLHVPQTEGTKPKSYNQPVRVYTDLIDTKVDSSEPYNFWGVVIDALTPAAKTKSFRQQLKIIDPSMCKGDTTNCITLTFFA